MKTTTTAIRTSHKPLREINDSASTTKRTTDQTDTESAGQHSQSVSARPLQHNDNTHIQRQGHSSQPPPTQNALPPSTSHSRYSKPYSLSKFAPKSHVPHIKPTSSDFRLPQRKSPTTQPLVPQYRARHSSQTKIRATRTALPNPKGAAPDSDIAQIWKEVQARVETMTNPTDGSQPYLAADTEVSDSDSQIERTLAEFNVNADLEIDPQLSILVAPDTAPGVSAQLVMEIKDGAKAPNYMSAFRYAFFHPLGMPAMALRDASDRIAVPATEEIILTSRYLPDDNTKAAGMVFLLAADQTWNDKFQREYLALLQKAGLFLPHFTCSDFLTVIVSCGDSCKIESLFKAWKDRATKALTKQLSVCRADQNEDRWDILKNSRYYGYLISGMNLEIHEMRYNLPDPPPEPCPQPKAQSEKGAKSGSEEKVSNINTTASNVSRPTSKSNPRPRGISSAKKSNLSAGPGKKHDIPLPLTHLIVKRFDLQQVNGITRFSEFHFALMRWAQLKYCAQYVRNLHTLCWQKKDGDGHPWFMTNAQMVSYWASAVPHQSGTAEPEVAVVGLTSPERAATAETEAWGEGGD